MAITCFVADMKTMAYSTYQQPWFFPYHLFHRVEIILLRQTGIKVVIS